MSDTNKMSGPEDEVDLSEAAQEMADAMEAAANEAEAAEKADEMSMEERFQMLAAENSELKDQVLRAHAEMDNIRKRAERQVADARVYSIEKFAGDLQTFPCISVHMRKVKFFGPNTSV